MGITIQMISAYIISGRLIHFGVYGMWYLCWQMFNLLRKSVILSAFVMGIIGMISCYTHHESPKFSAEQFKQYAIDAGVYDRIESEDGQTLDSELINWDEITAEDWDNWKNFVEIMRAGIADEKRNAEEQAYAQYLYQQYYEEIRGLDRDRKMEVYRKFHKKYPNYFLMADELYE